MRYLLAPLFLFLAGCGSPCKGVYTEYDSQGALKKFNEHQVDGMGCVKDTVALSRWESSLDARTKASVSCKPQSLSRTLVASNNFYTYRDGKMYLDLDGSTGQFRRLTLAEGKDGKQLFSRLLGCFYERDGQVLLDTDKAASSQDFDPMEIFTYTSTASTLEMVRFDDSQDWDYKFCPYLDTPWGFCDLLRNGNEMFFPVLTAAQQSSVLTEALLIRKQFDYQNTTRSQFESLWAGTGRTEDVREDYKYTVQTIVDTPRYIDQAWAQYVRGDRPTMPDITSSTMPPVCYHGRRTVTLADGSTSEIYGEICYENGVYTFTQ